MDQVQIELPEGMSQPENSQVNDADQKLHEICQMNHTATPIYNIIEMDTPRHQPEFKATCNVLEYVTTGVERSKKKAKKLAALNMLNLLSSIPENVRKFKMSRKRKRLDNDPVSALYQRSARIGGSVRCEFVEFPIQPHIKCFLQTNSKSTEALGRSKAEAKLNASIELLRLLENEDEQAAPGTHQQ